MPIYYQNQYFRTNNKQYKNPSAPKRAIKIKIIMGRKLCWYIKEILCLESNENYTFGKLKRRIVFSLII